MHELDIAKRIAEAVLKAAKKEKFSVVKSVRIQIGKMAAVHADQLEFLIRQEDPMLANVEVKMEAADVRTRCECGLEQTDERFDDRDFAHTHAHAPALYVPNECAKCGSQKCEIISGQEMKLMEIEGE